ncbi:Uncharacterised protein [Turicibacter sanguinis]|nr:Uncharacterised protein [Turicibacter sanguinis]
MSPKQLLKHYTKRWLFIYLKHKAKNKDCIGQILWEYQQKQELVEYVFIKSQTILKLNTFSRELKIP